ncbi:MAG: hypothetical protein ACHQPI_03105 [Thermoanaerobaculia bacterium]
MRSCFIGFGVFTRPPAPRSGFPVAALAALLLLGRFPAQAERDGGRILSPGTGETVVAGQFVELVWSSFPDDVEEMEILLSIDGGRYFPLRLTPRIDPRTGSFGWVVPRVATRAARLRIRFGRDGRETEGEPGAPFSIWVSPFLRPSPYLRRDGEWWIAEGGCSVPPAPGVSEGRTVDSGSCDSVPAVLPSSGKRAPTNVLCRISPVSGRRSVDSPRAFDPPPRAVSRGITPRRE